MRSAREPGPSSRASDQSHAPILAAIELLGQRWMLRVIWELEPGGLGFLELRRRMGGCSSSMLADRLRQLADVRLVEKLPSGDWALTGAGTRLGAALDGIWNWAEQWSPDGVARRASWW